MKSILFILTFVSFQASCQRPIFGYSKVNTSTLNILCRGNSLTYGSFATSADSSYPSRLQVYFSTATVKQQGIPGDQEFYTMLTTFTDSITDNYVPGKRNIVIAWEITNELKAELDFPLTPAVAIDSTYGRLLQFCQLAQAQGFTVIAGTCIARGGTLPASFDSCRVVINNMVKTNFPGLDIRVVPLDEIFNDPTNYTYYYTDNIHLNDNGYRVVYELYRNKILEIL